MEPTPPVRDLDDPNWQPPRRGLITAAAICGITSSLLWLWPVLLMLIALGTADTGGAVMTAVFAIGALAVLGFVAAALSLRGKIVWLSVMIAVQVLFLLVGLAAFGAAALLSLRFLLALATIVVGVIAMPQAAALRRQGFDF